MLHWVSEKKKCRFCNKTWKNPFNLERHIQVRSAPFAETTPGLSRSGCSRHSDGLDTEGLPRVHLPTQTRRQPQRKESLSRCMEHKKGDHGPSRSDGTTEEGFQGCFGGGGASAQPTANLQEVDFLDKWMKLQEKHFLQTDSCPFFCDLPDLMLHQQI